MKRLFIILNLIFFVYQSKAQGGLSMDNQTNCDLDIAVIASCPSTCQVVGRATFTIPANTPVNYSTASSIPWQAGFDPTTSGCSNWAYHYAFVSRFCAVNINANSPCPYDQCTVGTTIDANCTFYGGNGCFEYSSNCQSCIAGSTVNATFTVQFPGGKCLIVAQ
jgi:hypothetical protein